MEQKQTYQYKITSIIEKGESVPKVKKPHKFIPRKTTLWDLLKKEDQIKLIRLKRQLAWKTQKNG